MKKGIKHVIIGGLWFVGGLTVTILSYRDYSSGGVWMIAWGAILFGFIEFVAGLAYCISFRRSNKLLNILLKKCPICNSPTTLRTVVKGADKGRQFYVCSKYPKCKGRILILQDLKEANNG